MIVHHIIIISPIFPPAAENDFFTKWISVCEYGMMMMIEIKNS